MPKLTTTTALRTAKSRARHDFVYCTNCGTGCKYEVPNAVDKPAMVVVGAVQGAMLGSRVGIAAGPLGAVSGVVPGAIVGALLAAQLADAVKQNPKCPSCGELLPLAQKLHGGLR